MIRFLDRLRIKTFRRTVVALVWASVSIPVFMLCIFQLRDDYEKRVVANQAELEHKTERVSFAVSQALHQIMSDLDRIASDGTVIRSISLPMLSTLSVAKLQNFLDSNSSVINVMSIDRDLFPVEILPNAALNAKLGLYREFMADVINSPDSIRDPRSRLFVPGKNTTAIHELTFVRPILAANNSVTQPFVVEGLLYTTISTDKLMSEALTTNLLNVEYLQLWNQEHLVYTNGEAGAANMQFHKVAISLGRDDAALQLVMGSSTKGVIKDVLMGYREQAALLVMFMAATFIATKLLAEKLALPLRTLSQLTRDLSQSHFKEEVLPPADVASINYPEFVEVFDLLGHMQSTIRQQFEQLYEANANLEDKVAQRTEALEQNIQLLAKQKESLSGLVRYSIEVQQASSLDEAGLLTLKLAEHIAEQCVGIYVLRSESYAGYQNYDSLEQEYRQFLLEHTRDMNDYASVLRLAKDSLRLHFFMIGSSTSSYQGFLVTEKSERSSQTNEAIMVLCTILGSAIRQHNLNNKLNRLAHIDSVTHLPNRHYFSSRFNEKVAAFNEQDTSTQFGVFVVDVNGLKTINDSYGHQYGDEMLQIVSSAIKKLARANDTVARVGGDEFYLILENANAITCEAFAQRLEEINGLLTMTIEGDVLPLSFSFGYASTDLDSLKNLIHLADERMYFAKKNHYRQI